jgi:predicted transglutaminase-like cysteine proteinase
MTVVRKRNGEGHAVLTLRTTEGDYVLDNLSRSVKRWRDTPYAFVKRQSSDNPQRWVSIEDGADLVVGSVKK